MVYEVMVIMCRSKLMHELASVAPASVEMTQQIVWCTAATVDGTVASA
jgi:hypothetical protein